jgi:C-terminal processing protease CtpA/Prc
MKMLLWPVLLVLATPFWGSCARAADAKPDAKGTARLVSFCKVWGTVRYLHPYLAYKDIDWDAALIAALPKVEAAKDENAFRAAVQAMLDRLGDSGTRVARKAPQAQVDQPGGGGKDEQDRPLFSWVEKDVLAIHLDHRPSLDKLSDPKTRVTLLAALKKASGLIVDLRGEDEIGFGGFVILSWLSPLLPAREVRAPVERYLVHSGYRPQMGMSSGGYSSAFQSTLPQVFPTAPGGKGKRTAFLVVEQTELPPNALALREAGEAFLVAQGKAGTALGGGRRAVPLTEDFEVQIRTTELIGPRGPVQVQPDAEVPADADRGPKGPAFQKALALLRDAPKATKPAKATEGVAPPQGAWRPDKRYETMAYPEREYRLLALFRFWNVIHYFYPYKDLLDQDWDTVLPRFLPRFAAARDALEYNLAVAEMAACIQDTHTTVAGSKELNRFFGEAAPPVALRLIEGKPAVTDLLDAEAVKGSGVAIGDVVLAIDGEPSEQRMARYGKYLAGSNPGSHAWSLLRRLLNGPDGSTLQLTVRGRDDKPREIALPRKAAYALLRPKPSGEVFKILADNIGYCDLERLTLGEVDAMLERLKDTRAIVFDLRGYPRGTAWALAPRLNVRGAKYGASFQRMVVSGGSSTEEGKARFAFRQPLPTGNKWKYRGKTVTLIDERAISQSEHTGLFLEAACATTFIGSPTAGANGDVTTLTLPGGLVVVFTGHDVRHIDGRQLQRVGLVPHVEVRPTLAGIRAGQDEVLARALQYLREGK